jgi:hypothetical protein
LPSFNPGKNVRTAQHVMLLRLFLRSLQGITHKLKWNQTIRGAPSGPVPGNGAGRLSDDAMHRLNGSSSTHNRNGNGSSSSAIISNGGKVSILPPVASGVTETYTESRFGCYNF